MKTITEFPALNLKTADKTRKELTEGGKTAEELPAALGEALKVEGDRLKHLMNALDAVKKVEDLKRVVVYTLLEGEKPPTGAVQVEESVYVVEYYPPIARKDDRAARGGRDGGRDGGRGGKGGRDGKGGKPGRGGERGGRPGGDRGGRPGGEGRGDRPSFGGGPGGEGRGRPPGGGGGGRRPPGGPRPQGSGPAMVAAPNPVSGKRPKVVIVNPKAPVVIKPVNAAAKPAATEAPAASADTGSSESSS